MSNGGRRAMVRVARRVQSMGRASLNVVVAGHPGRPHLAGERQIHEMGS